MSLVEIASAIQEAAEEQLDLEEELKVCKKALELAAIDVQDYPKVDREILRVMIVNYERIAREQLELESGEVTEEKLVSKISQAQCSEKGIPNSMSKHICIGMPQETQIPVYFDSA